MTAEGTGTPMPQTPPRIAIFGGSFNPPGKHHREIARVLADRFDEVIVVPCGPRPDKPFTNDVPTVYRAAMVDMTFQGMDRVRVELFDLESGTFTRTHELEAMYRNRGETWHVIGTDLIAGGAREDSPVHREWHRGAEIWEQLRFAVVRRPGFALEADDLPPKYELFEIEVPGASSEIRTRVFRREDVNDRVLPRVASYIERHGLYRGMQPSSTSRLPLDEIRPLVVANRDNPAAVEAARQFEGFDTESPNLIVVIGGDGTMLRTIRQEWRRRIPFYGINTGQLGFLLNHTSPLDCMHQGLTLAQLALLRVEFQTTEDETGTALAFNDAWVERATGQTAWLKVKVNGRERIAHLVADGALVSTAAGSTSYARAMGAPSLPLGTPALLLVGSNVFRPSFWKPVVLSLDSTIELETRDTQKRPLRCYVDGIYKGEVQRMSVRTSNIASVELAFAPEYDLSEKLARIQFPMGED